jgi:hypothetical protein
MLARFSGITIIRVSNPSYKTYREQHDDIWMRSKQELTPEARQALSEEEDSLLEKRRQALEKLSLTTQQFMATEAEKNKANPNYYAAAFPSPFGHGDPPDERLVVDGEDLKQFLFDQHVTRQQYFSHMESKIKSSEGQDRNYFYIRPDDYDTQQDTDLTSLKGYSKAPIPRFYDINNIYAALGPCQGQSAFQTVQGFADLEVYRKYREKATHTINVTL